MCQPCLVFFFWRACWHQAAVSPVWHESCIRSRPKLLCSEAPQCTMVVLDYHWHSSVLWYHTSYLSPLAFRCKTLCEKCSENTQIGLFWARLIQSRLLLTPQFSMIIFHWHDNTQQEWEILDGETGGAVWMALHCMINTICWRCMLYTFIIV